MKRGFLNTQKAKKSVLYPQPSKETPSSNSQVSTTSVGEQPKEMKILYGKVENNDIPKDYIPVNQPVYNVAPTSSPDTAIIVVTTVPPTGDPDIQSEWLTLRVTKLKVLDIKGFPHPVPKPAKVSHVIKETKKMGKGVFATRDIQFGELVFAERPLIVTPANCNISGVSPPSHYTMEQQQRIILMEHEKKLEDMVRRMSEKNRQDFKELMNTHTEDGSGPLLGVIRTNGFGVMGKIDENYFSLTRGYTAIGKIASRINHSCIPNVKCDFSTSSFSLTFTAQKAIKAGEQLFYSYVSKFESREVRQKKLAPYGIICECEACVKDTTVWDLTLQEFSKR